MNHLVELTCKLFEQTAEAEQAKYWQPLIYPLVWHEVNIISQRRYFTRAEELNIKAEAKRRAKYAIFPPIKNVEFDVLLEEFAFRGLVLGVFYNTDIQIHFARRCSLTVPNEFSFLNSLTYHWEQVRLFEQGIQEVIKRIRNNPEAYLTLGAIETGEVTFTQQLQNELAEQTSWMSLPEHVRLDKIGDSVQDWLFKLMEMPVMTRYKNSFLTALDVEGDLINKFNQLTTTKKGRIESEMKSLYEEVRMKDGSTVPIFELIPAIPTGVEIEFTEQQKEELRKFLNETEVRILEAIFHDPYATQEEIAQEVGCVQPTVSKAIREYNRYKEMIKEILGID